MCTFIAFLINLKIYVFWHSPGDQRRDLSWPRKRFIWNGKFYNEYGGKKESSGCYEFLTWGYLNMNLARGRSALGDKVEMLKWPELLWGRILCLEVYTGYGAPMMQELGWKSLPPYLLTPIQQQQVAVRHLYEFFKNFWPPTLPMDILVCLIPLCSPTRIVCSQTPDAKKTSRRRNGRVTWWIVVACPECHPNHVISPCTYIFRFGRSSLQYNVQLDRHSKDTFCFSTQPDDTVSR